MGLEGSSRRSAVAGACYIACLGILSRGEVSLSFSPYFSFFPPNTKIMLGEAGFCGLFDRVDAMILSEIISHYRGVGLLTECLVAPAGS